jgi:hypothetical protein
VIGLSSFARNVSGELITQPLPLSASLMLITMNMDYDSLSRPATGLFLVPPKNNLEQLVAALEESQRSLDATLCMLRST